MNYKIIPSVIAKSQKELDERFSKISSLSKTIHLDLLDGKFVKTHSLDFDFNTESPKNYEAHLMIKNPEPWIRDNAKNTKTIFFHFESTKSPEKIIKLIKSKKRKVGIAINPKTPSKKIFPFLKQVDVILVMTVNPGHYGAKFLPSMLNKISEIRKADKKINIQVDGG